MEQNRTNETRNQFCIHLNAVHVQALRTESTNFRIFYLFNH